jgi:hypothetical protein
MNDNVIDIDDYKEKKFLKSIRPEDAYDEEELKAQYEAMKEQHRARKEQDETI